MATKVYAGPVRLGNKYARTMYVVSKAPSRDGKSMWRLECHRCDKKKIVSDRTLKEGEVNPCSCTVDKPPTRVTRKPPQPEKKDKSLKSIAQAVTSVENAKKVKQLFEDSVKNTAEQLKAEPEPVKEQKPSHRMVEIEGETLYLKDAIAKYATVGKTLVHERLKGNPAKGIPPMNVLDAILTPKDSKRKRTVGKYVVFGESLTLLEAIRRFGKVSRQTVYSRLKEGMDLETALTLDSRAEDTKFKPGHKVTRKPRPKGSAKPKELKHIPKDIQKQVAEASQGLTVALLTQAFHLSAADVRAIIANHDRRS